MNEYDTLPADEDGGPYVYCPACSLASGADRPVYHEPPACRMSEADAKRYQTCFEEWLTAPPPAPAPSPAPEAP